MAGRSGRAAKLAPMALLAATLSCGGSLPGPRTRAAPAQANRVRPLAWGTYGSCQLVWGRGEAYSIDASGGPDGIYEAFRPRGGAPEQLEAGAVAFIDELMPKEFVYWLKPVGRELTIYAGGESRPFTELLRCDVACGDGPPRPGQAELEVTEVELPARLGMTWTEALAAHKPVVLLPGEDRDGDPDGVFFRVRVKFRDDIWKSAPAGPPAGQRQMSLGLSIDLGAIAGNEDLKACLDARKGGGPAAVALPVLRFRIVRQSAVTRELRLEHQAWRVQAAQSREGAERLTELEAAYAEILKLVPQHEVTMLACAELLESAGRPGEAAAMLRRLKAAMQGKKRDPDAIGHLYPDSLRYRPIYEGEIGLVLEQLLPILDRHIARLGKKATEAKGDRR